MKALAPIERFLNNTTMYRVVLYGLGALAVISIGLGFAGILFLSGMELLISLGIVIGACLATNALFAWVWGAPTNHESALITALILFFIVIPASDFIDSYIIALAGFAAMASKYIISYRHQHIFNPAAFGSAVLVLLAYKFEDLGMSAWWIGNAYLFIPMLIVGILIVWKIRRWGLVLSFVLVGLAVMLFEGMMTGQIPLEIVQTYFLSWPTLFLGTVMLTEPLSTPPRAWQQYLYGGVVAFLVNTTALSGIVPISPELALMVGNAMIYPMTMMHRIRFPLLRREQLGEHTLECVFEKPKSFSFTPGQYLEWTLPHKDVDSRGIRRYFTIASSPTEEDVRVAVHVTEGGSSFKKHLVEMDKCDGLFATQLDGEFVMPKNKEKKLVFIAGGIGVTPFRSMLQYLLDTGESRDAHMFFCNRTRNDIVYQDLLDRSKNTSTMQFDFTHVIANPEGELPIDGYEQGFITEDMLKKYLPDYAERTYYISGPPSMVGAYKTLLSKMNVPSTQVVTDYFPGLA